MESTTKTEQNSNVAPLLDVEKCETSDEILDADLQQDLTQKNKPKKEKKQKQKKAKAPKEKIKKIEYTTITEVKPIMHTQQISQSETMYFDSKTGKPLYGPTPMYIDEATGKPVYSAHQAGVQVVETTVPVTNQKQKASLSIASTVFLISGLVFFSICFFMISLSTSTSNGIFWGIIILTWLFGPIMMITVPPICYIISVVLMVINFFKNPKCAYTWACIPINAIFLAGGIYLMATYLPNFL